MEAKFIQREITPEQTLGQILKEKREKYSITLEEIARKTKIRQIYLEAFEQNDYGSLPSNPYAKGILKRYTSFLNLNSKKTLALYERQKGIDLYVEKGKDQTVPKPIHNPRIIITPKTYLAVLIILAFVGVLAYIGYQFRQFATPPELSINYPPDNITIESGSITVEGKTNPHADLLINQQFIPIEEDGSFRSVINLQNGINFIKVTAKNRINKENNITRKILAKVPENIAVEKPAIRPPLELFIKINPNSAWLYIEADNKQAYQGIMLPGTQQTFQANEYISITTRNGGSVEIVFNGKNTGKLGAEGEVIKGLRFDKNTKVE
jgi:transcriptional regulator with XRE-family HTH domain